MVKVDLIIKISIDSKCQLASWKFHFPYQKQVLDLLEMNLPLISSTISKKRTWLKKLLNVKFDEQKMMKYTIVRDSTSLNMTDKLLLLIFLFKYHIVTSIKTVRTIKHYHC